MLIKFIYFRCFYCRSNSIGCHSPEGRTATWYSIGDAVSLCGEGLVLVGDEGEQFLLDGLWDFDEFGALTHDIGLLDPAAGGDVVADGVPLALFDDHVLAAFVEDARNGLLLFQVLDAIYDFLGGELELVGEVFEETQFGSLEDGD
jgi:hypothetical protein